MVKRLEGYGFIFPGNLKIEGRHIDVFDGGSPHSHSDGELRLPNWTNCQTRANRTLFQILVQNRNIRGYRLELESRDLEEASRHFRQVLEREPAHAPSLTALGKVAFEQKTYIEAIRLLQQIVGTHLDVLGKLLACVLKFRECHERARPRL